MYRLNTQERDVLDRIERRPELQSFFFRKARGLKWFDELEQRGFFDSARDPRPVKSAEDGTWSSPLWLATRYLVAVAPELSNPTNNEYALRVLRIVRSTTKRARQEGTGNCRTWCQFAEILPHILPEYLADEDIDNCVFWMDDCPTSMLLADRLSEHLLAALLNADTPGAKRLARSLLAGLTRLRWQPGRIHVDQDEASFYFRPEYAGRILGKLTATIGRVLRQEGVEVFMLRLQEILDKTTKDQYSAIWRPAIEDNDQNLHHRDAAGVLVDLLRDSLNGFLEAVPSDAVRYIQAIFEQEHSLPKRVAIYLACKHFPALKSMAPLFLVEECFRSDYQHELWHFLHTHYSRLLPDQQKKILEIVNSMGSENQNGQPDAEASWAYERLKWLSALHEQGHENADELYERNFRLAGTHPEHPDFPYYVEHSRGEQSAYRKEDLLSRDVDEMIDLLTSFREESGWGKPTLRGLSKEFRQAVKSRPNYFTANLKKFVSADLAFIYELIEAYREIWQEESGRKDSEKTVDWEALLDFCLSVVARNDFWTKDLDQPRDGFVANRSWVVGAIAELLRSSTGDEHALDASLLATVRQLIDALLLNQEATEFDKATDAVHITINTPRGKCLEALIAHALHCAKLERARVGTHKEAWADVEPAFNAELQRRHRGEYEFVVLMANWLRVFLYLNTDWTMAHLPDVFSTEDEIQRLCAMQGYSYNAVVYPEVYRFLRDNGHLLWAIESPDLKPTVKERVLENIVLAYLGGWDTLKEPSHLMPVVLERRNFEEYSHVIWFIWTLRDQRDDIDEKVMQLWKDMDSRIDRASREGKFLYSKLCTWSVFVQRLSGDAMDLLARAVPFVEDDYNGHVLIQSLAGLVTDYPSEVAKLYLTMLERCYPTDEEEHIKEILKGLWAKGDPHRQSANDVVDAYVRHGVDFPAKYLVTLEDNARGSP